MALHTSKRKAAVVGAAVVVAALGAAGAAVGSSDDDRGDTPITGTDLDRASDAALAETGEGRVTGTEVDDEESKYEVEVTLDDGSQVDVQLDENFNVVGSEGESGDED